MHVGQKPKNVEPALFADATNTHTTHTLGVSVGAKSWPFLARAGWGGGAIHPKVLTNPHVLGENPPKSSCSPPPPPRDEIGEAKVQSKEKQNHLSARRCLRSNKNYKRSIWNDGQKSAVNKTSLFYAVGFKLPDLGHNSIWSKFLHFLWFSSKVPQMLFALKTCIMASGFEPLEERGKVWASDFREEPAGSQPIKLLREESGFACLKEFLLLCGKNVYKAPLNYGCISGVQHQDHWTSTYIHSGATMNPSSDEENYHIS